MLLILVVACGLAYWRFHTDRLNGDYYQGDGLGYNLHLTLENDGTFTCQWTGCLGDYGSTSGEWSRSGRHITVNPTDSSGMFKDTPLGNMTILKRDGGRRLIRDADANLLATDPDMLSFFSFGRVEAD